MTTEYKSTSRDKLMDRLEGAIKREKLTGRKAISMGHLGSDGYGRRSGNGKWNDGDRDDEQVKGPAMPKIGRRGS